MGGAREGAPGLESLGRLRALLTVRTALHQLRPGRVDDWFTSAGFQRRDARPGRAAGRGGVGLSQGLLLDTITVGLPSMR